MNVKRLLDVFCAGLGLFVLSPLMLVIALLVKVTSPGPVLFRQQRLGFAGLSFELLKFRTMFVNAPDVRNADGSAWSGSTDPRVTTIGRLLRLSSLDELPQLINVLYGDMSLVGPRPDQVDQIRYYTTEDRRKLLVKPGITGLAQIAGRNTIVWSQRKALDVEYVERQSFALDVLILARTIPYVLRAHDVFSRTDEHQSPNPK